MKILYLGPFRPEFCAFLESWGDEVQTQEGCLEAGSPCLAGVDFLISYGYRHILRNDVLDRFPRRVINLHISLLPWNRGADPNLWSFLEDTPKGVTVHYVDGGLDTGDIISQAEVIFPSRGTLRSTYQHLCQEIEQLFYKTWPRIRLGEVQAFPQPTGGTCHRRRDREPYDHLLSQGWDTPVANLIGKAGGVDFSSQR